MFLHDVLIGPISLEQILLSLLSGTLISKYWFGVSWTGALYYGGILAAVEIITEYFDHKMNFLPPMIAGFEQVGIDGVAALLFGLTQAFFFAGPAGFSLYSVLVNSAVAFISLQIASYAHDLLNIPPFVTAADAAVHKDKKERKKKKMKTRSLENASSAAGADVVERALRVNDMARDGDIQPLF